MLVLVPFFGTFRKIGCGIMFIYKGKDTCLDSKLAKIFYIFSRTHQMFEYIRSFNFKKLKQSSKT